MNFNFYKLSIPIFTIMLFIGVINFYNGFMKKMITVDRISQESNPYTEEMYFDNEEQRTTLQQRWFIPQSSKIVFNFVDALPYYLVFDQDKQENMSKNNNTDVKYAEGRFKTITEYLNQYPKQTVLLRSWAESYTTTTNRLRAYGTGTSSGVQDIYYRFGTTKMPEDNIFMHFKPQNEISIILGDDLWLQFFGDYIDFSKSQVISRKEDEEDSPQVFEEMIDYIQNNTQMNWNLLMFHDSILDHTCHYNIDEFEDKFHNPVFNQALKTIDQGVKSVIEQIEDLDTTYLILSDHGLSHVAAKHGYLSDAERSATFFAYNKNGFIVDRNISQIMNRETLNSQMDQVDFTPTFCMLKGIAIPANNLGVIVPDVFVNLPWVTNLYIANAYFTNLRQIEDFVKESSLNFPRNETEIMFEKINVAKNFYQSLKEKQSMNTKQSSQNIYQPSDEELAQFINQVRSASAQIKEIYFGKIQIDFDQSKFAVVCIILFVICSFLSLFVFDKIIQKGMQPYMFGQIFISKKNQIIILLSLLTILIAYQFSKEIILQVLNIAYLVACIGIIGYSIYFILNTPNSSVSVSLLKRSYNFIKRIDFQTFVFLMIVGIFPILFSQHDFLKYMESSFFLIISMAVSLISIHSLVVSILKTQNMFIPIVFKSIAIIVLLYLTFYFDPKIAKNINEISEKWFLDKDLFEIINQPLFIIQIPLIFFSAFYILSIYKATKFLRDLLTSKSQKFKPQLSYALILVMHFMNLLLSVIYFSFKQSYLDDEFFFSNFFPISSLSIIILQVLYFQSSLQNIPSFQEKYSLFFWSLLPFFLYFMGDNSIFQITSFFIIMNQLQNILKMINYRQHWFMYTFLNLMTFIFYSTQGNVYRSVDARKEFSKIGMIWDNEYQYYANLFISTLTWFIIAPLYIPVILQKEIIFMNVQHSLSKITNKVKNNIELPQTVYQDSQKINNYIVEPQNNEVTKQNNFNFNEQSYIITDSQEEKQNKNNQNISTLYCYQIKLIQSIFQYKVFFAIALIPNFVQNICDEFVYSTNYFTSIFFILTSSIAVTFALSIVYIVFSKNMYTSMIYKLQSNKILNS